MKGWTMPIQRASYRGVRFEVISVDDELNRATIDHAYPFVNGADIEDLGLNPLTVRMQAVFYGEGYYTDFKQFLSALQKQGADVLVHPIRGRLPNMLCTSANFRHDAEMIDYVALDLTFVESTPAKPIFVFEFSFLAKIDELLTQLEDFIDEVLAFFAQIMEVVAFAMNVKSRLLGAFGALQGCFEQLCGLFDMGKTFFSLPSTFGAMDFKAKSSHTAKAITHIIEQGLTQVAQRSDLTTKAKFDETIRTVKQIQAIPQNLLSGKNMNLSQQQGIKSLTMSLSTESIEPVHLLMQLTCTATLIHLATGFIEDETLLPQEIDYITTLIRTHIVSTLQLLRHQAQKEQANSALNSTAPNTGVYTATQQIAERLRTLSHHFTQLAISAINRKPPLTVRVVPFNGTIQQIAHAFYGDYRRSDELLRLNPQVRFPNFIAQGELLNSYVN
ncbi:DNA circularization protein [Histophilus somni]|uniref:DNA circularization protein n=1 Tax=Histophilus somni TaxID=731 RepID=UPI000039748A|nr:DNA circularization N-terminal domain-containing protein [Histophilus somni]ACA32341.1 putative phage virion protein [Histophilus somni 2336]